MAIIKKDKKNKSRMARVFSCAAKGYDNAAFIQKTVAQRLLERCLCFKDKPQRILNIGSATGWFAQQLQAQYPKAHVIGVDYALGMCRVAHTKLEKKSKKKSFLNYINKLSVFENKTNPSFVCADMEKLPFQDNSFDLIISNCTVEWSSDLFILFRELKRVLKTEGILLFSTLGPDTCFELAHSAYQVDAHVYTNPFLDMHNIGDILVKSQWNDPVMDREVLNISYSTVQGLLSDIGETASHYLVSDLISNIANNIITRDWLEACTQRYKSFQLADNSFPATIEIIYGYAAKKPNLESNSDKMSDKIPTAVEWIE